MKIEFGSRIEVNEAIERKHRPGTLLDKSWLHFPPLIHFYEKANNKTKREIIGSIFPEKPVFGWIALSNPTQMSCFANIHAGQGFQRK